jgi:RNA polymerase sigma-70 factor (ECF subfamily)
MQMCEDTNLFVSQCLGRLRSGDHTAREELLARTCDRLVAVTRKIKRDFAQVGRWEQTEDVFQNASLRLCRAMAHVEIKDSRHFFRLAAAQIRRELLDLVRHWHGPEGPGRHHMTQLASPRGEESNGISLLDQKAESSDAQDLLEWCEFHQQVERLPEECREVFDLLYYHGLSQEEAATALGVSSRTIKRRWRDARLALHATTQSEVSIG